MKLVSIATVIFSFAIFSAGDEAVKAPPSKVPDVAGMPATQATPAAPTAASAAQAVPVPAPAALNATAPRVDVKALSYNREDYYGVPVYDADKKLLYVEENKSQTHSKEHYVFVKVRGIKNDINARAKGRIRIAMWNEAYKDNYAVEGTRPFRACSHWAKDVINDEMTFKIGVNPGEPVSYFAHFDEDATGLVKRGFLSMPVEQYVFTNAKNQGKGPGLKREGISKPRFEHTLVRYTGPGQEVELRLTK